jgi:DNA-directed RNA polymerase subunit alpha
MPHIQVLELSPEYGKFVLEPLERGYGQTIGNALRRMLLSSIPGVSITGVRIDKVFHEFSAIPGVKEDATELLLNLKDLAIKVAPDFGPLDDVTLTISIQGPGRVTGADIICPEGISIVNPETYIATISESNESLNVELFVGRGTGYVLPEKHERFKGIIGILPVGTQYTPVRKVNYFVELTRVGMQAEFFERLILDVWTNGAISPNDALAQAAQILDKYLKMFFDIGQLDQTLAEEEEESEETPFANIPDLKIDDLQFSQRTYNCLRRASILSLRQLAGVSEAELCSIRGFGKKSLHEVRDKLAQYDIHLKPSEGYKIPAHVLNDDKEDYS